VTLEIYDTTLRDGAQGVGISFSVSDKLRIAEHLDTLGVSVIEGGWPGANPTDTEFFAAMRTHRLRNATLAAFGATRRPGTRPQDDLQLRTLLDSMAPIVTLVGKTWDRHVADVLRTTREENLAGTLAITVEQIADIAAGNLPERELYRAKENLKGRIVLSMESTSARMNRLGKSVVTDSEILSLDRVVAEIEAVEPELVCELAMTLLAPERLSASGIGPNEERFLEALEPVTPALARAA